MKKPGKSKRPPTKRRSQPPTLKAVPSPASQPGASLPFPIVGIGASAGGLEALELFLKHVPKDSGLAFVIVQHLDPTHQDLMVELLQRITAIPVVRVRDRMKIAPNHVYIIPPNRDLSLLHGNLHLIEPVTPRGLRLPIDFFFRSLAADLHERSIGVILSGMGSDGTLGVRAIKEQAGAVFVQEPTTAKFSGMPQSVIAAGLADVVAPVEELPDRIIAYLSRVVPRLDRTDHVLTEQDQSALDKILILLRAQTGHDFSLYKKKTLYRRIERRMGLHDLAKIGDYVRYLQSNPQEADLLFKELLIGVTSFFRDPTVWEELSTEVLPALLASYPKGGNLRAWVPACSTGEEVYTLAIAFKEALHLLKSTSRFTLQIFATDLDKDAIEKARAAVYPSNIAADVSPERLARYFVQEEQRFRVNKELREMVIFATQNLVMDPPFTKLDLLSCRNLLIYLEQDLQKKLIPLFHYSLKPGGILLLGSAETIGQATHLFTPLPGKSRIYRHSNRASGVDPVEFPAAFTCPPLNAALDESAESTEPRKSPTPTSRLPALADHLLLQYFSPAAVLINVNGDIVYINGKTGKYLEPAAGKTNWNIFAMAREGLDPVIFETVRKAVLKQATVTLRSLRVGTNGGTQIVDLTVKPLAEPEGLRGMVLVIFNDVATPLAPASGRRSRPGSAAGDDRRTVLEQELRHAREELQAAHEEKQTSQEELKSTNEELQSTNEELQSTNEELTTSKEEMQSMNEELHTVNQELQAKVDELSWASNDMKNLLNSTEIATVFLDEHLRLRRFTTLTSKIIRLLPGDVGRPITHITTDLDYPSLADDVETVMQSLIFKETAISTRDGRWFNVRIMPYRTQDNRIDGVVITFVDITAAKKMEIELRAAETRLRELLNREQTKTTPA